MGVKYQKIILEILKKLPKKRPKSYQKNFGDRRRCLARDANVEINCEQPNIKKLEQIVIVSQTVRTPIMVRCFVRPTTTSQKDLGKYTPLSSKLALCAKNIIVW